MNKQRIKRMKMSSLCLLGILAALFMSLSCDEEAGDDHQEIEERLTAIENRLTKMAVERNRLGRLMPDVLFEGGRQPGACFEKVKTIVRNQRGNSCDSYEWELAPASEKCVIQCREQDRYREAVDSGQDKCQELCIEKNCRRGVFTPPDMCEDPLCFQNFSECQVAWPHYNGCFLVLLDRPWNCRCLDI